MRCRSARPRGLGFVLVLIGLVFRVLILVGLRKLFLILVGLGFRFFFPLVVLVFLLVVRRLFLGDGAVSLLRFFGALRLLHVFRKLGPGLEAMHLVPDGVLSQMSGSRDALNQAMRFQINGQLDVSQARRELVKADDA